MTTDNALVTGVDGAVAGNVIPFEKNAAGLFKISGKTHVKQVVFHATSSSAVYLSSSPEGVAHIMTLPRDALSNFWKESPYTWGNPKGVDPRVYVALGGASVPHRVESRGCTPPMVCSLMSADLSGFSHGTVDFEDPNWVAAMQQVEQDESPERAVYKSTLAFFRALNRKYPTCPYVDPASGDQCAGHWTVVHPRDGKPFVGCSGWRPGHPSTRCGGHLGAQISSTDSPAVLEELQASGPRPEAGTENCIYIAPKASKAKFCFRHGGVEPRLVTAGGGSCEVRSKLFIPTSAAAGSLQVIDVLRGTHSHVFPVLKPSSTLVARVVRENTSQPMRTLQVRFENMLGGWGEGSQREVATSPDKLQGRACVRGPYT
ncbi:hypothetical protein I4F81_005226 [Pyropia yezoensis]|uniref:Uncharacterized protein n=1 Tax=Pyropia yezoensis TaxID=2788 RepID=A0ACC3BXR5_PYRYE|nr:hypothetical protein I4F81_005226 [Neopyropia yezoensis]